MRTPRNWKLISQTLVNRGNFTLYVSEESLQKAEDILQSTNKTKRGRPFSYNPYLILLGFIAKSILRYGYRQAAGFMEMIKGSLKTRKVPNFRTLWRRINKMEKFGLRDGPGKPSVLDMQTENRHRKINQKKWKWRSGYNKRPHIESEIWSFKKTFGEGISSKLKEMRQKELLRE